MRKDFCWTLLCTKFLICFFIWQALLQSGFDKLWYCMIESFFAVILALHLRIFLSLCSIFFIVICLKIVNVKKTEVNVFFHCWRILNQCFIYFQAIILLKINVNILIKQNPFLTSFFNRSFPCHLLNLNSNPLVTKHDSINN